MKRIITSLALCAAAGGLFAEAADAATETAHPGRRGERCDKALGHLKEKHPELFKRIDANGDGEINGGEFRGFLERREENLKEKHPELFAVIDTDGDGNLDRGEVKAAHEAREKRCKANHPKAFDKVDRNNDGELDRREVHQARDAVQNRRQGRKR